MNKKADEDGLAIQNGLLYAISKFAQQNGKLDILINNAGGGARNSALSLRMQDVKVIDGVLNTNLRGSLLCAKYSLQP